LIVMVVLFLFTFILDLASILSGAVCNAVTGEHCLARLTFG
jgi:hypothetical protein